MIGFVRPSGGWFVPSVWRSFCLGIPLQIGALLLSLVLLILNLLAQKIGGADAVFFGSIGIQMMTIGILVLTGSSGASSVSAVRCGARRTCGAIGFS